MEYRGSRTSEIVTLSGVPQPVVRRTHRLVRNGDGWNRLTENSQNAAASSEEGSKAGGKILNTKAISNPRSLKTITPRRKELISQFLNQAVKNPSKYKNIRGMELFKRGLLEKLRSRPCGSAGEINCDDLNHWLKRGEFTQDMEILRQQVGEDDAGQHNASTRPILVSSGVLISKRDSNAPVRQEDTTTPEDTAIPDDKTSSLDAMSMENNSLPDEMEESEDEDNTPSTGNEQQCTFTENLNNFSKDSPCQIQVLAEAYKDSEVIGTFEPTYNAMDTDEDQSSLSEKEAEHISSSGPRLNIFEYVQPKNEKEDCPFPRTPGLQLLIDSSPCGDAVNAIGELSSAQHSIPLKKYLVTRSLIGISFKLDSIKGHCYELATLKYYPVKLGILNNLRRAMTAYTNNFMGPQPDPE